MHLFHKSVPDFAEKLLPNILQSAHPVRFLQRVSTACL
jgi:hypothetical protein